MPQTTPEYVTKDSIFDIVFGEFCACSDETEQVLNSIIDKVRTLSTADVAPVIHGILKYSPQDDIALCSKCGEEIYLGVLHQFAHNYCPHCGAKMDGTKNE